MIKTLVSALPLITLLAVSNAWAVVVDFDGIDATGGPTSVTDEFQSLGVVFDGLYIRDVSDVAFYTTGPGSSATPPNVGIINDESPFSLSVYATFVDPVTGSAGITNHVHATFFDTNVGTNLIEFYAFDINGQVVDSAWVNTPATQYAVVELNAPGIHSVLMRTDPDGTSFDNFTFNEVAAVPVPAALWLFASGLISLCMFSKKQQA